MAAPFTLPLVGGVIVGVKWLCITFAPWIARAVVQSLKFVNLRNVFLTLLAGWGISALFGRGDAYIEFLTDRVVEVVEIIIKYFFDVETGYFWDACVYVIQFGFRILEYVEMTGVFDPLQQYGAEISWSLSWIGMMNRFFPIVEIASMMFIFFIFIFVYIVGKLILKLIPGIG